MSYAGLNEDGSLNWSFIIVIIIGTFMSVLDGTIVNVALPKMINVFGTTTENAQWIVTAYMLTLGIIMPISGFLADTFGYKRVYSAALAMFTLGSALCGIAWNVNSLVFFRVIQALGGGLMQPLGMAIMYKYYPRERIGAVLGVWGIAMMAAPAVGPTLGGYLVDYATWRFIFYINVPVGLVNVVLAAKILKETELIQGKHLDIIGLTCSCIGFFFLMLAITQGSKYGWGSPLIVGLFITAIVSLIILVLNELKQPEPVLDMRVFSNYVFTISVIISCIISIGMFGVIFMVPLFLQSVLGQTAMQTGLIMFPAAIASGLMMPFSGAMFDRYGARALVISGLLIVAFTTFVMGSFNEMTLFSAMTIWLAVRGLGMGLCFMPVTTAGMNTVPLHLVGRASALNNSIRQVASAFGVAMFTLIMQNRQTYHFANLAQSIDSASSQYAALRIGLQGAITSLGAGIPPDMLSMSIISSQLVKKAMVSAVDDCFIIAAILCLLATVLSLFLRDKETSLNSQTKPAAPTVMD